MSFLKMSDNELIGLPFSVVKKKKFYKNEKIWIHFKGTSLPTTYGHDILFDDKDFEYNGPAKVLRFQKYQSNKTFFFDLILPNCISVMDERKFIRIYNVNIKFMEKI